MHEKPDIYTVFSSLKKNLNIDTKSMIKSHESEKILEKIIMIFDQLYNLKQSFFKTINNAISHEKTYSTSNESIKRSIADDIIHCAQQHKYHISNELHMKIILILDNVYPYLLFENINYFVDFVKTKKKFLHNNYYGPNTSDV